MTRSTVAKLAGMVGTVSMSHVESTRGRAGLVYSGVTSKLRMGGKVGRWPGGVGTGNSPIVNRFRAHAANVE